MNIILLTADEIRDGQVVLQDHRAAHIQKVLQAAVGDRVKVGILDGLKGSGVITAMEKKSRPPSVTLAVHCDEPVGLRPEIDLILALPRPIMLKRILSQVAALGIGCLYLIHANRVEKSFWEAGLLAEEQYRQHFRQGLEQAVDTRLPRLELHRKFKPFVEDVLPVIGNNYGIRLLAHPYGESTLAEALSGEQGRILLAVGPEGGWVDFEVAMFQRQGFSCCSIGERILKVDTAVIALHARVSAIREVMQRQTQVLTCQDKRDEAV
jgi:16S rRNA (uracil1498-N3)-methyltransferase